MQDLTTESTRIYITTTRGILGSILLCLFAKRNRFAQTRLALILVLKVIDYTAALEMTLLFS